MIQDIAAALQRQDFAEASRLLQTLPPDDPWSQLYQGQLHEHQQAWDLAEDAYRSLLRSDSGPKISSEARQGLQRLTRLRQVQRQQQRDAAIAEAGQTELGVLILEPMPSEAKTQAAQALAKIMQLDPYSARLLLPSHGWRLYRSGPMGEMQLYGQELRDAGIPVFWQSLQQLKQIEVHQVFYFETDVDPVRVAISNPSQPHQPLPFHFSWSDVTQQVKGQLPIFEEVVDLDPRGKLKRKEQIQDHAQFCDLHLQKRNCILRFYDTGYQFNQGIKLTTSTTPKASADQNTSWAHWRRLMAFFDEYLPDIPTWSDFAPFAEAAVEQIDHLGKFESHINLLRRAESDWDQAFQLYSGLAFLKFQHE